MIIIHLIAMILFTKSMFSTSGMRGYYGDRDIESKQGEHLIFLGLDFEHFNFVFIFQFSDKIYQVNSMKNDLFWKEMCEDKKKKTVSKNVNQEHFEINCQILCIMGYGGNACLCA